MTRPAKYSREEIVAAAERVVARLGAPGLSFDAVAREAGVSKGAVLHYFGTKEALIGAMVARLVERLAPQVDDGPGPPDRAAIARLIARTTATPGGADGAATALLAAVAQDLASLAPIRAANRTHLDRLGASVLGPFEAQLLHFALDGLWLSELLGVSPLTDDERKAFVDGLMARFAKIRSTSLEPEGSSVEDDRRAGS
jgi:AcrR family transcriptional regulator